MAASVHWTHEGERPVESALHSCRSRMSSDCAPRCALVIAPQRSWNAAVVRQGACDALRAPVAT